MKRPAITLARTLACAALLAGAAQAQTGGNERPGAESAQRFLATAVAACDGVRLGQETFDQARTRLGLSARDDQGISKGSVGRTAETIVQTNLGFRLAPSSGAQMCSGAVSGLNLPAEALSRFAGTEIERRVGGTAAQEGQTNITAGGSRQSAYMIGDEVMMMLQWDPPTSAGSDEPVTTLFIMSWMPGGD